MGYREIVAGACALIAISTLAVGLVLGRMRQDAFDDLDRELASMATIFSEQVERSSQAIDLMLDQLVAKATENAHGSEEDYAAALGSRAVFLDIKDRLGRLPQADVITLIDRHGRVLNITRAWPTPELDLSDRDYFVHLQATADHALFLSRPVQNKVTGAWTVYFAKRVEAPDGRFMGVVMIGFRPEYFLRTLDVVSTFPGRSLLLLRNDGTVLLRHPDAEGRTGYRMPLDSGWYPVARTGGSYRSVGVFDGRARRVMVRPTSSYPLVVDVAAIEEPVLADWRARAWTIGLFTVLVDMLLILAGLQLHRQFRRLQKSQSALEQKNAEISLANVRLDATLASMAQGIAMFDGNGRLMIRNDKFLAVLGLGAAELGTEPSFATVVSACRPRLVRYSPGAAPPLLPAGGGAQARLSEVWEFSDGRTCRISLDPMRDGGWVATCEDVTGQLAADARVAWLAHHDVLTGLANRALFIERIAQTARSGRAGAFAIVFIDLDRFKEVNDTFGHGVGDMLLVHVAQRIGEAAVGAELIARLGGDEFGIMLDGGSDLAQQGAEGLVRWTNDLIEAISRPFQLGSADISVGASAGLCTCGGSVADAEEVMRRADLALYSAKAEGRGTCRLFEAQMEEDYGRRQGMINDLRHAAERGELALHYQPIVDAVTLEVVSMEALLRWTSATYGPVSPAVFIPLAEEAGLICELGEWVLVQACRDAARWAPSIRVAVNVSAIQICQSSFVGTLARVMRQTGLEPRRLQLEITESALVSDTDRAERTLVSLRGLDVAVVLDDFGTGYSSLSYLKRFPFTGIKIDKSFVEDLDHRGCAAVVAATTMLAREFDMSVTAEGVETEAQLEQLRAASVPQLQGYFLGRPAPAAAWPHLEAAPHQAPPASAPAANIIKWPRREDRRAG